MVAKKKQGQISLTFNWIYVLIAGAVILLFFVGIVVKQKAASEEMLAGDIVGIMDSIFNAAGVSEKTKNFLDISGLAGYTLYFDCMDGLGEYGVKGSSGKAENAIDPIFAPLEISASQLIVWSLPYKLPYKVIDFLFVTSINTKYFLFGESSFAKEFIEAASGFNIQHARAGEYQSLDPGKNFQVRIIDADGNVVREGSPVPQKFSELDKNRVTAVSFIFEESIKKAVYYSMDSQGKWRKSGPAVPILSLGGEKDAASYAAVFAQDGTIYQCNMKKALKRLEYVNLIYEEKLGEIERYYETHLELPSSSYCLDQIKNIDRSAKTSFVKHKVNAATCLLSLKENELSLCSGLLSSAPELKWVNGQMGVNCMTLY